MPPSSARERSSSAGLLSIGQVLARLNPEFPNLTSSKLRFLEVQGIVTPTRTESGYRKFSQDDLERLRLALTLQRDHYLPLVVIREYLADVDAGRDPAPPTAVSAVDRARPAPLPPRGAARRRRRRPAAAQRRDQHRSAHGARTGTTTRRSRSCGRWSRSTATASSRATCARSARAPSATSRWSSRRCRPCCDARMPHPAPVRASSRPELAKRLDEVRAIFARAALDRMLS